MLAATNVLGQSSLDENKRLSQLVLRSWTTDDGLTSESVNELVQTDDGYIWIGTYTGLHRFDGKDFNVFNSQNSTIPSSNVLRAEISKEGDLWLGTLHGIVKYENGDFITPKPLEIVSSFSIEDMLFTASGGLWFSTKSNHLFRYENNRLKEFTHIFGISNSTVLSIAEDSTGNVYFGTDDSQLIIYSSTQEITKIALGANINGINTMYPDDELIYIGTGRGLYTWNGSNLIKSTILPNTTINSLIVDQKQYLMDGYPQRFVPPQRNLKYTRFSH